MARKQYPSDHRRWFRVMEDVLHHPKIQAVGHDGLATYIKILAIANQRKAHETGGKIELDRAAQMAVTGSRRSDSARIRLERLANVQLLLLNYLDNVATITLPNYAEKQGFAPTKLRPSSDETPATTPTPTYKKRDGGSSRERSSVRPGSPEFFLLDSPFAHPNQPAKSEDREWVGEEGNSTQEWTGPESPMEPKQH